MSLKNVRPEDRRYGPVAKVIAALVLLILSPIIIPVLIVIFVVFVILGLLGVTAGCRDKPQIGKTN